MNIEIVNNILDKLDKSANSNTFWLPFSISNDKEFELQEYLIKQLRTGRFHFEVVKQDIERGWNNYSEMVFPKNFDTPAFVQVPGNVWNGKDKIEYEELTKESAKDFIIDLLTGEEKHFSKSLLGKQIKPKEAQEVVGVFFSEIEEWFKNLRIYNLKPDFLNKINNYYESDYIQLGYFENAGRDLALAFKSDHDLSILLTNGYQ